ncbi:MAG: hypothetical protein CM1200mP9_07710 [Gammaproteobacteria bacterium]|nr:MAG: hypothetical protein CM1200mP9_07710 [Gammaproteobacteria bacterium]
MKEQALTGKKYRTDHGHMAIKNGIKATRRLLPVTDVTSAPRKPPWLRVRPGGSGRFESVRERSGANNLQLFVKSLIAPTSVSAGGTERRP